MADPEEYQTLRRLLVARGLIDPAAAWRRLSGGRTNLTWAVGDGRNAVVCKLYRDGRASPLFANSPAAEQAALQALAGTGLAPDLLASLDTAFGPVVLYRHIPGDTWRGATDTVARLLATLHAHPAPASLPAKPMEFEAILAQGDEMLAELGHINGATLRALRPEPEDAGQVAPVFLHGDPVPANIVMGPNAPVLVDWQCPGVGDPCEDLAIFLSPAMQHLYGDGPLEPQQISLFLGTYGKRPVRRRYRALKPAFNWRMAVYCAWQAARGFADYQKAVALELAELLPQNQGDGASPEDDPGDKP